MVRAEKVLAILAGILFFSFTWGFATEGWEYTDTCNWERCTADAPAGKITTAYLLPGDSCIIDPFGEAYCRRFHFMGQRCELPEIDYSNGITAEALKVYALSTRMISPLSKVLENANKADFKIIEFNEEYTRAKFYSIDANKEKVKKDYRELIAQSDYMKTQIDRPLEIGKKIKESDCVARMLDEMAQTSKENFEKFVQPNIADIIIAMAGAK